METRSAKRRKVAQSARNNMETAADRISDLPDHLVHHILSHLPIKCVAQMSVLSKRWRFLWTTFPDLDFTTLDSTVISLEVSNLENYPLTSTPMDFINQVLSVRDKHSDIRILRFRGRLSFSRLNNLIRGAIRHNVRELDIEVDREVNAAGYFNFPRYVIGSESLRVLKLRSYFLLPQSSIMRSGFQSLQTFSLKHVNFRNQSSLSDLFSGSSFPFLRNLHLDTCHGLKDLQIGCCALENLSLEKCFQLIELDICCAKLERMRVVSCFLGYSDEGCIRINAPKLEHLFWQHNAVTDETNFRGSNLLHDAYIGVFIANNKDINAIKVQSINDFLSGLSQVRSLTLQSQTIEILSYNKFFSQSFYNLKSLELHTCFNKSNVHGLACLFRSSPTLHTLILRIIDDHKVERKEWNKDLWDMISTEEEQYWESQIPTLKSFLLHLKVAQIHGFLDCENEVTLAKFLLKHGKALEEMILQAGNFNTRDTLRRQKIRSQMMGFSWASSNAKVTFQ